MAEPEVAERQDEEVAFREDVGLAQPAVAVSFWRAPRENLDMDGDGFPAASDPDDADPRAFPLGPEVSCDGVDQDGDGLDACAADLDGDGVRADQDCDDANPEITPLAPEVRCNGEDENCDGADDCDRDGDGYLDRDDFAPDDPAVTSAPSDRQPGELVAEDVEF
ncbi:MAG: putative metal-binding motif-containing protein [Micrococcales bacterium]|nr:putative metal-binding motif-containing protein [Micrococcales bacterium]